MDRKTIFEYADKKYKARPEYLWAKDPDSAVLRHKNNNKWYAVIMNIPKNKLGLDGEEKVDIIDLKCDPDMVGSLCTAEGIFAGYHMNKKHWITVLLDGTVEDSMIYNLLDMSFGLTETKKR